MTLLIGVLKKLSILISKNIKADIKINEDGTIDIVKNNPNICLLKRLLERLFNITIR